MAARDLEAFVRECGLRFDPGLDVAAGGVFDTKVVQPLVMRLGANPFDVDTATFLETRLAEAFPSLAVGDGDVLNDFLVKANTLLLDPIVREVQQVRLSSSYANPAALTKDDADALGANTFCVRDRGDYTRETVRVHFDSPRDQTVNPSNFVSSKGGLRFFPINVQTIKANEMLANATSDGLYYFEFDVIAERAGAEYNVELGDINSIANVPAAVRVANVRRRKDGAAEQSVEDFIASSQMGLGEKSLSTLRGICAKLPKALQSNMRINVVGHGDPEMMRDVLRGGSLGDIVLSGNAGYALPDLRNELLTRWFATNEVDFVAAIGATGYTPGTWCLTLINTATSLGGPPVVDCKITKVIDAHTVELEEAVLSRGALQVYWALRKRTLKLGSLPGGLLPSSSEVVYVEPDAVHIGGAQDIYIKGNSVQQLSTVFSAIADESPALRGSKLAGSSASTVVLGDLTLGVQYSVKDSSYQSLVDAARFGWMLRVYGSSPCAGDYRVLSCTQVFGTSPVLTVTPALPTPIVANGTPWEITDSITISLTDPKDVRVVGTNASTVQGTSVVHFGGTDLRDYGVSAGDVVQLQGGNAAGSYTVTSDPIAPTYNSVSVSASIAWSNTGIAFSIYRKLGAPVKLPMQRVTKVELLDSNGAPTGTLVPYGAPVDAVSRSFQNPARGVLHDIEDGTLGIVSLPAVGAGLQYTLPSSVGCSLRVVFGLGSTEYTDVSFDSATPTVSLTELKNLLNTAFRAQLGLDYDVVVRVGYDRLGFLPVRGLCLIGGNLMSTLFGDMQARTVYDVRSATTEALGGWNMLTPAFDPANSLTAVHVLGGSSTGDYGGPFVLNFIHPAAATTQKSNALFLDYDVSDTLSEPVPQAPVATARVQVGLRSIGSARVYFLAPTTFEVDAASVFSAVVNGRTLEYLPDPTMSQQCLPPLPGGKTPSDGTATLGSGLLTSSSQDFVLASVSPGDLLQVGYVPLRGTVQVVDDVITDLVSKTLIFSVDDGDDRVVTFVRDDLTLPSTSVAKASVTRQINAALGRQIAAWDATGRLVLSSDVEIVVRMYGTANDMLLGSVVGLLGTTTQFSQADRNNRSPCYGTWVISSVSQHGLSVVGAFPTSTKYSTLVEEQTFKVMRRGVQRTVTADMAANKGEAGLYYADVELLSKGIGDDYNVDAGVQFSVSGYRCDGYTLSCEDSNLSYSLFERPYMHVSKSILLPGVDDSPTNATGLRGRSLQITYEYNDTVGQAQDYVSSSLERVLTCSSLVRSLLYCYVRLDLLYSGGSREDVMLGDVNECIRSLPPVEPLRTSTVQNLFTKRGATYLRNPITLLALVHNNDRSISTIRSTDSITAGRLSTYEPDVIVLQKKGG